MDFKDLCEFNFEKYGLIPSRMTACQAIKFCSASLAFENTQGSYEHEPLFGTETEILKVNNTLE